MRSRPFLLTALAVHTLPTALRAQDTQGVAPRSAVAVGWSPAAGVIGGEWVRRAGPGASVPLGFAFGAGLAGPGARVHLALGRRATNLATRRVPYAGVSVVPVVWLPITRMRGAMTAEGGMQFWPAARRRAYFDLGAGAALVFQHGGGTYAGPVLRALAGVAF